MSQVMKVEEGTVAAIIIHSACISSSPTTVNLLMFGVSIGWL